MIRRSSSGFINRDVRVITRTILRLACVTSQALPLAHAVLCLFSRIMHSLSCLRCFQQFTRKFIKLFQESLLLMQRLVVVSVVSFSVCFTRLNFVAQLRWLCCCCYRSSSLIVHPRLPQVNKQTMQETMPNHVAFIKHIERLQTCVPIYAWMYRHTTQNFCLFSLHFIICKYKNEYSNPCKFRYCLLINMEGKDQPTLITNCPTLVLLYVALTNALLTL